MPLAEAAPPPTITELGRRAGPRPDYARRMADRLGPSGWATLLAALLTSTQAPGATVPSIDLRGFEAPTDPEASARLEPARTPGHLAFNAGLWASYAYRSIVLEDESGHQVAIPLEHQLSLDYVAGLGLTDRLALGVALPTVVHQSGDDAEAWVTGAEALPGPALGDLSFTAKAALIQGGELGGFGLSALSRLSLPTGNKASYASDSDAVGELSILSELRLLLFELRVAAGARVRGSEHEYLGSAFGHELPWAAGLVLHPQAFGIDDAGHLLWTLEAHGAVSLTPSFGSGEQSPAALGAMARYAAGDFGISLGAELPLNDAVGLPRVRGFLALSFAPRFVDRDGDEIGDEDDECPELAEDRDGFEDGDGCPDFDNDDDGVPDATDRCPAEKEDPDGYEDEDGCADTDNDHDGVRDAADACPDDPGPPNQTERPGCPLRDRDMDGIPDSEDRCPRRPEDRDAFEDDDGCPDLDDDKDGVRDNEDACPRTPGPARSDPELSGCPSPDLDGDSFDDAQDRCPDGAEDFDGDADDDGCPDPEPERPPLAHLEARAATSRLVLKSPLRFGPDARLEPASEPTLRAIASILNQNPEMVLLVGVRPSGPGHEAEQLALTRSFAVVQALREYTHRDEPAETIGWSAVRKVPGAVVSGVGFLVLMPKKPASTAPP